jgi:hypothetical protein
VDRADVLEKGPLVLPGDEAVWNLHGRAT